jgi:hypothetical protein
MAHLGYQDPTRSFLAAETGAGDSRGSVAGRRIEMIDTAGTRRFPPTGMTGLVRISVRTTI